MSGTCVAGRRGQTERKTSALPGADAFDHAYRAALEHVLRLGESGMRHGVAEEVRNALAAL